MKILKKISLLSVVCTMCITAHSQIEIDHLYQVSKNSNPFFGNERSTLNLSMDLVSRAGEDSVLKLVVEIIQQKLRVDGLINSTGGEGGYWELIGGLAGTSPSSEIYSYNNTQRVAVLDYNGFDTLLSIIGKIKTISGKPISYNKTILYKVNKIVVGLDIKKEKDADGVVDFVKSYYFQIDESSVKLSESQYKDLVDNSFFKIKHSFDSFKNNRLIVAPIR